MSLEDPREPLLAAHCRLRTTIEDTSVYPLIHIIRNDIIRFIDTPLTHDALNGTEITYTLVKPLVEKYLSFQQDGNNAVVFCILLNRVHFKNDRDLATSAVSLTRAELCEILAILMIRYYGGDLMDLTLALTTNWPVYNGADPAIIQTARLERNGKLPDIVGNAIELAILSKAKKFIKSSSCQTVVNSIWSGKCVYTSHSSHSILSDTYKRNPIHFYDPHKAPLLDHYRLKVPAIRAVLEYTNFLTLFLLFFLAIEINEVHRINAAETLFMVYGFGYCLEKIAAMQEHGIRVYFKGTWNGFDTAFVINFFVYAIFRLYGVYNNDLWAKELGTEFLAICACLMFPRLAFVTLKNNLMVLSLRAMIVRFVVLMLIAAFCFLGFLYALWTLSRANVGAQFSVGQISWWMLDLFFGLDASGFDRSVEFHPFFGPVLMVAYACLSNTLLLTVLVSILSNTFATISEDAAAEAMFRRAVSTIEGVKADFLFSYQPPINLIALLIMLPSRYILSPRWFHKLNVFMIRLTNFPILLFVAWYERQAKKSNSTSFKDTMNYVKHSAFDALPKSVKRFTIFEGLSGSESGINAVFDIEDEFSSALDTYEYHQGEEPTPASHITHAAFHQDKDKDKTKDKTKDTDKDRLSATSTGSTAVNPPNISIDTSILILPEPAPAQQEPEPQQRQEEPAQSLSRISSRTPPSPPLGRLRERTQSFFHRSAELVTQVSSPLAQIFQPLVVEDTMGEEPLTPSRSPGFPTLHELHDTGGFPFGPSSRIRRLSAMARRPSPHTHGHGLIRQSSHGSDRRLSGLGIISSSPEAIAEEQGLHARERHSSRVSGTSHIESDVFHWKEKFDELEKRQDRIESLLKDILSAVKPKHSDG